jgi:hypothetical protein
MYGVSAELDLTPFLGLAVIQVAVGEHQVQLNLHPEGSISIEGSFELTSAEEVLVKASASLNPEGFSRLVALVGTTIVAATAEPPSAIRFEFSSGHRLRLIESSKQYECFVLEPGPIII